MSNKFLDKELFDATKHKQLLEDCKKLQVHCYDRKGNPRRLKDIRKEFFEAQKEGYARYDK